MKAQLNLVELAQQIMDNQKTKADFVANTRALEMTDTGKELEAAGGEILHLPRTQWTPIAQAA